MATNQQAPRDDHVLNQGAEYRFRAIVKEGGGDVVDLSSYTCTFKARAERDSGNVLFDLSSLTSPTFITLGESGELNIDIPASTTAGYTPGEYYYDIHLWPTGSPDNKDRVLEGIIEVRAQVVTS